MIDQYHFLPSSTGMIIPPVRVSIFIWYNVQTKLNGAQWRANEQEMTIFQARWRANEQLVGGWALATYFKNPVCDSSIGTPDTMKCGMIILHFVECRPQKTSLLRPRHSVFFCLGTFLLRWWVEVRDSDWGWRTNWVMTAMSKKEMENYPITSFVISSTPPRSFRIFRIGWHISIELKSK